MCFRSFSDEELFSLLQADDHDAFTEIYKRYSPLLLAHTLKRLPEDEAMDIVQELFTYLWKNRAEIQLKSQLSAYLYTAVRNRVINCIAHKDVSSRYYKLNKQTQLHTSAAADYLVREKQLAQIIEAEIGNLPAKMQLVFRLSRYQHLSHREIAVQLNLSELTVKKQVNKALRILRVKLGLFSFLLFLLFY